MGFLAEVPPRTAQMFRFRALHAVAVRCLTSGGLDCARRRRGAPGEAPGKSQRTRAGANAAATGKLPSFMFTAVQRVSAPALVRQEALRWKQVFIFISKIHLRF